MWLSSCGIVETVFLEKISSANLALQSQVGTEVPTYVQIAAFILARNTDPDIAQDDSHMLSKPNYCLRIRL